MLSKGEMDRIPLRQRNRLRVTQRILMTASQLFKTRGYHSTTMDDIAEGAEISRGTLFNYFPTKESLLLPWGQEIVEQQILSRLEQFLVGEPPVWQVFHFLFSSICEKLQDYPDVIRAFVGEAVKNSHQAPPGLAGDGPEQIYARVIRYGQERGEIRRDLPLENLTGYLGALQMSLIFRILDPAQAADSCQEIDHLLAFMERGLKTEKIE